MNTYAGAVASVIPDRIFVVHSSQLFGEHNEDEDVSPDTEDPEAVAAAGDSALQKEANEEVSDCIFYSVKSEKRNQV